MILTRGRAAASLMLWLVVLGAVCASAQVDNRPHPPFRSSDACVEFARGDSPERRAQPAARRICDEIARVWQDPSGAKPAAENPLRIDFGAPRMEAGRRAAEGIIDGVLLARILTVPNLLPPHLDRGLVLENLLVAGTLEITDAEIDLPVVLREARFRPNRAMLLEDNFAPVAIRLDRARFSDVLEIRESDIGGHVLIDDSTFSEGLTLTDVAISTRAMAKLDNPRDESRIGSTPALRVRGSTFGADFTLTNVLLFKPRPRPDLVGSAATLQDLRVTARLYLRGLYAEGDFEIKNSDLGAVTLQDFQFRGNLSFEHNSVAGLEIADGRFYHAPYITQNRVRQNLWSAPLG